MIKNYNIKKRLLTSTALLFAIFSGVLTPYAQAHSADKVQDNSKIVVQDQRISSADTKYVPDITYGVKFTKKKGKTKISFNTYSCSYDGVLVRDSKSSKILYDFASSDFIKFSGVSKTHYYNIGNAEAVTITPYYMKDGTATPELSASQEIPTNKSKLSSYEVSDEIKDLSERLYKKYYRTNFLNTKQRQTFERLGEELFWASLEEQGVGFTGVDFRYDEITAKATMDGDTADGRTDVNSSGHITVSVNSRFLNGESINHIDPAMSFILTILHESRHVYQYARVNDLRQEKILDPTQYDLKILNSCNSVSHTNSLFRSDYLNNTLEKDARDYSYSILERLSKYNDGYIFYSPLVINGEPVY